MHRTACVLIGSVLASAGAAQPKPAGPPPAPTPRTESPALGREAFDAKALYDRAVRSCVFLVAPTKDGMGVGVLIDADRRLVLTTVGANGEPDRMYAQFPARDRDGAILTDKKKYIERLPAGAAIKGTVVHADRAAGLAVVRLDKVPADTPTIPLARESAEAGSPVLRIGHSADEAFASAAGEVRGFGTMPLGGGPVTLELTDRKHTGGPGWPVIDGRGRLVGVTDAKHAGVALDITEVRAFLADKKIELPDSADKAGPKD